jgi:hypothetical protein
MNFIATQPTYWIAHEEGDVQSGTLDTGQNISTPLKYFEQYTDYIKWSSRLSQLNHNYDKALQEHLETLRLQDPIALLADYRWRKETGGYTLSNGFTVSTTRETQAMINSTITGLSIGLLTEPIRWKGESGWMSLSTVAVMGIAGEVAGHVNRCFKAEDMVATQLATNPTLDVKAAFDTAYQGLLS